MAEPDEQSETRRGPGTSTSHWITLIVALAVLAFYTVVKVEDGEHYINLRLGEIQSSGTGPATVYKIPFMEQVLRFDSQPQRIVSEPGIYLTTDKARAELVFEIEWQVADVERYYVTTSGRADFASQRLSDVVKQQLRNEVAHASETQLSEMLPDIAFDVLQKSGGYATELGVDVNSIDLERIGE